MTFEEIDARYRAAALSGEDTRWDDTDEPARPDEDAEQDGGSA